MTKRLFHIPKSDEDLDTLVKDIIKRNPGNIDVLYMYHLGQEAEERKNRPTPEDLEIKDDEES